jgi:hypothetical protein
VESVQTEMEQITWLAHFLEDLDGSSCKYKNLIGRLQIAMTDDEQEIFSIIVDLRLNQIEQTRLLDRLEVLQERTTLDNRRRPAPTAPRAGPATREPRLEAGQERLAREAGLEGHYVRRAFRIGDRVRITNPGPGQFAVGKITRILKKRITVTDRGGEDIMRDPKNLMPEG